MSTCDGRIGTRFLFYNTTSFPVYASYLRAYPSETSPALMGGTRGDSMPSYRLIPPHTAAIPLYIPEPSNDKGNHEEQKVLLTLFLAQGVHSYQDMHTSVAWQGTRQTITGKSVQWSSPAPLTGEEGKLILQYLRYDATACQFRPTPLATNAQGFSMTHHREGDDMAYVIRNTQNPPPFDELNPLWLLLLGVLSLTFLLTGFYAVKSVRDLHNATVHRNVHQSRANATHAPPHRHSGKGHVPATASKPPAPAPTQGRHSGTRR